MTRTGSRLCSAVTVGVAALAVASSSAAAAPLPASGTLDLAEAADARLAGAAANDLSGQVVGPAGDVNGDGRPDLLVSAPSASPRGRRGAGVVHVVFGPADGLPKNLGELGERGLRIEGAAADDHVGWASAAGDVDGDELGDVLVGAPNADAGSAQDAGAAYLVRGRREAGAIDLAVPGQGVTRLSTGTADDRVGSNVGSVPDVDGDGRPELLIGAPLADDARGKDGGSAFVVFARRVTAGGDVDLSTLGDGGLRLDGAPGARAGFAVAGAPDSNADGRGEILVGAPLADAPTGRPTGAAYVVFGRPEPGRLDLAALGTAGYAVTGSDDDALLGARVGVVGDPDGNGATDLAFAATAADRNGREDSGSVHVIPGKAGPEPVAAGSADRPGFRIDGAAAGDRLGSSASAVGDLNSDGRSELVVAAPQADALSREEAGAAYVVFGSEEMEDLDLSGLADMGFRLAGPEPGAHLSGAAGVSDLDGDKVDDLLAGAYGPGAGGSGAAFVVLGPKPPATPPPPPDPGVAEEVAAGCKALSNVEVIVDDSLSMRRADPLQLRRQAIDLLLTKPRNVGKVVGAFEFGSRGRQLFAPQVVQPRGTGSNQPLLLGALQQGVRGNNGGTDYNAAFKGAADDNPGAQARVFITDGGHRAGKYLDGHRGGAPTFVIGLGIKASTGAGKRLARIARETEGRAFVDADADELPEILNTIDSKLNCDVDIDSDEDVLSEADPVDEQVIELLPDARTCDIDVNWGDDADSIEPEEIAFLDDEGDVSARVTRRGLQRVVARPGKTFRIDGITLQGRKRGTFYGLRIAGRDPAERLRVRYRAAKVSGRNAKVTSQVSQSRRRSVVQPRRRG